MTATVREVRSQDDQWWTVTHWLDDHPDHPDYLAMRGFLERGRRSYLEYGRQQLGWGVFVLRLR